jgi:GT2 family glycosyltransferase
VTPVDVAVSIVSYRTPELVRNCLRALDAARGEVDLDVTVVDNASGDGSDDIVRREFPWVRVIANPRNVGFGAAHNQALRQATARYAMVLNSDAAIAPGALKTLVEFMDAHPDAAVAGPKLRYPDGSVQSSRRRFPSVATLFLESTQVQRFWTDNSVLRHYYVADRSDDEAQEVDWLAGACLCVRTRAIDDIGLFDERFFMYSEELDWCRRFRAAGWRVWYVPTAEAQHHEGASARLDLAARDQRFQTSKVRYAEKWHGPRIARALRAYLVLEYVARAAEESAKIALGSRTAERHERLGVIGAGLRHAMRG